MDGDGDLDLIAGNSNQANRLYLNTLSTAPFKPYVSHRGQGQSLQVDALDTPVTQATVFPVFSSLPNNTFAQWWLSNNGGLRWWQVKPGVPFVFPGSGNDLRWKVELGSLSPKNSIALNNIGITYDQAVPTPTPLPTGTVTVTPSASPTTTPSASPTTTITLTPTPVDTATATPTATPAFRSSNLGKTVLAPVPAKKGEPVCIWFTALPSATQWQVFNTAGEKVSDASFGGEYQQCLQTQGFAAGLYYAVIETIYPGGKVEVTKQKLVIVNP